jgi:flagellar biosynthesis/type III secretory pathway protein FliH
MPTPHDRFFRHVFADPEQAEGELRTVLPAAIVARALGPRAEEAFMTGAQLLREEGRQQGRAEGKAEGKAEGRAEGEAKGKAEGKAQAVLAVLEARGLRISDEQRARVLGCADLDELERWVRKAVTVKTTAALFVAARRPKAGT